MNREHDRSTDVQIKQVLAEETYSPNDWQTQLEYVAAAMCCWSDEHEALLEDLSKVDEDFQNEATLVSGRLLPFYKFRPGLGSL